MSPVREVFSSVVESGGKGGAHRLIAPDQVFLDQNIPRPAPSALSVIAGRFIEELVGSNEFLPDSQERQPLLQLTHPGVQSA